MKAKFLILTFLSILLIFSVINSQSPDNTEIVDDFDDEGIKQAEEESPINQDNQDTPAAPNAEATVEATQQVVTTTNEVKVDAQANDATAAATSTTSSTDSSASADVSKGYGIKCFWFYDDNVTFDFSSLENKTTV